MTNTCTRVALLLVIIVVGSATMMGQSISFKIPITLNDSRGHGGQMNFGIHPLATYCPDPMLYNFYDQDSLLESGLPPENTLCDTCFEWRFIDPRGGDPDCLDLGVDNNIHHYSDTTQIDTFQISFRNNIGYPFIFRWPKTLRYYADSMFMKDALGIPGLNLFPPVNMTTVDSFRLTNTSIKQVRIYMYGPKPLPPLVGPPSMISPANDATGQTLTLTFSWGSVVGASQYRLQVSTDPLFTTLFFNDTTSATSKQVTGLAELTKYYWRVAALNVLGAGAYPASGFTFSTLGNAPTLISPVNNANNVPANATLIWKKFSAGAQYHLQISTDQTFATTFLDVSGLTDTTRVVNGLANCNQYYWHVSASSGAGSTAYSTVSNFTVISATPAVPILVAPSANLTNVALSPTLSWTAGDACSQSYTLQVRLGDSTSGSFAFNGTVSGTSQAIGPLNQLSDYWWRVQATSSLPATGPFSSYRKFTTLLLPPATPVLISPAQGASTVPTTPTFTWNHNSLATTYQLQVSDNLSFATTVFDDSTLTDTVKQVLSVLTNCKPYYWRVRAKNAVSWSAFASTRNFTVVEAIPGTPILSEPVNDQDSVVDTPILKWNNSGLCTGTFRLQVATDVSFSAIIVNEALSAKSKVIGPLLGNTDYYWRVKDSNSTGSSAYAGPFHFKTTPFTLPPIPVLISPSFGQSNVLMNPTLTWNAAPRATAYRLQVAIDSLFTIRAVDDTSIFAPATSKQIGPLLIAKTYYWRLSARNSAGTSKFSDSIKFTTMFPPASPSIYDPVNGATGVSLTPIFNWGIIDGATAYELMVSLQSNFSAHVFDDTTITATSTGLTQALLSIKDYYARVRGKNAAGWGNWSSSVHFTTQLTGVADWMIPLAVSETGPARDTLRFGISPGATAGIDPGLGEFELPPAKFGMFDARFYGSSIGEGLLFDVLRFRYYTQVDTFLFKFQPGIGSYPMHISWPASFIQGICDSMIITDNVGGFSTPRIRMDLVSSITVTDENIFSMMIIEYGAKPVPLGVTPPALAEIPKGFMLQQNYPNPFNPSTQIQFSTENAAQIRLAIYDVLGREVSELANGIYYPGVYSLTWDGKDLRGSQMPSGVYYVRMLGKGLTDVENNAKRFISSRKMLLMK